MRLPLTAGQPRVPLPPIARVAVFALLFVGYVLLGLAGLQLQSAQTGVSPVWPASGFAFLIGYWFGYFHLLAIVPAMLVIARFIGIGPEAAAISALGSISEAALAIFLLQHFKVDPKLRHMRDALLFVGLGPVLGPVASATLGSTVFFVVSDGESPLMRVWLVWWLGNSIGLLLVGGFGLVAVARRTLRVPPRSWFEMSIATTAVIAICAIGMSQAVNITSPLVLYLLIPVFVLVAQRGEQYPVLLLGMAALGVMLLSSLWLPSSSFDRTELGVLYLDVSLLWVVTFTGMVIAGARQEMRAREQVSWLASHDPLTRLMNRHAFMDHLEVLLFGLAREPRQHVLMFLDLDRFKDLNDAEGHRAGDQVLREVGVILGEEVRGADRVARLGGDEFVVLLEDCALLDACSIAENIRKAIEAYEYRGSRGPHRVEVSIGLVELDSRHLSPEEALHDADSACYAAKRAGRNRIWVLSEDDAK